MSDFPPPAPPYVGPPYRQSPGSNKPITRIVIHSAVCPCEPGWAQKIAEYFRSTSAGGSAHYCIDPENTRQSAYDSVDCWHAPPDKGSLGLEMCDYPGPVPNDPPGTAAFKAAKRAWRWIRPNQRKMLRRTADLTADLCLAYDVPPVFIGVKALRAGHKGVTTHNEVSNAFGQSSHWDPGFWPRRHFMSMVRKRYRARQKAAK